MSRTANSLYKIGSTFRASTPGGTETGDLVEPLDGAVERDIAVRRICISLLADIFYSFESPAADEHLEKGDKKTFLN